MAISFNQIPSALRVPFTYVEFDNSGAQRGAGVQKFTTLIYGQMLAGGSATALTQYTVTSTDQAKDLFGAGSHLYAQIESYKANDSFTEVHVIGQVDDGASLAAEGSIEFTGPATADGVLALYIAGKKVSVVVLENDLAVDVATNVAAAVTADADLMVDAAVDGVDAFKVVFTAKNAGENGNQIDLRLNYALGDAAPAGIASTIVAMSGGATNPDVDDVLSLLTETQYNVVVNPYLDSANLTKLEAELALRFGPLRQNEGVSFSAWSDSVSGLTTLGNSRNSPHSSIMGVSGPSHPLVWSAAYAAQVSQSAQIDPAKPFQTLPLLGVLAPSPVEEFALDERNNLLFDGISTYRLVSSQPIIERAISTYQLSSGGSPDISYLDLTTLYTLSLLRFEFRTLFQTKYSRHKLANDGTAFGPGQPVMTPSLGKSEAIALFTAWQQRGLVEGQDQFENDLIVERSDTDPNRLDFSLPVDLVNALRVVGAKIPFLI